MPTQSRSHSLRESRAGQRTGHVNDDTADQNPPARRQLRSTRASLSTATPSGRDPSPTKLSSTKLPSSETTDADRVGTVRSATARRSLLMHPATHKAGIISGHIEAEAGGPTDTQTRPKQDARSEGRRATLRPRSMVLPDSSQLSSRSSVTSQPSIVETPKPQRRDVPPAAATPSSATRPQRSASLRQPATPRPKPTVSHSRHRSQVIASEYKQAAIASGPVTPSSSTRSPTKPTFQQHQSPRKPSVPPTPSTPSVSNAGGDGVGSHVSSQVTSLQAELLQLHILHSQALQAKTEWESNNKKHFERLHASAVAVHRTVASAENNSRRRLNANAIDQWRRAARLNESYDFLKQIQLLSRVVQEVTELTDTPEARYELVQRRFKEWSEHTVQVRQSRTRRENGNALDENSDDADSELGFIDPLDEDWRDEVNALRLKLEPLDRELDCLNVQIDGDESDTNCSSSALVRIVKGHKMMLSSMLDELRIMPRIEKEVIRWENTWVRNAADRLCQTSENELHQTDQAMNSNHVPAKSPIWAHV